MTIYCSNNKFSARFVFFSDAPLLNRWWFLCVNNKARVRAAPSPSLSHSDTFFVYFFKNFFEFLEGPVLLLLLFFLAILLSFVLDFIWKFLHVFYLWGWTCWKLLPLILSKDDNCFFLLVISQFLFFSYFLGFNCKKITEKFPHGIIKNILENLLYNFSWVLERMKC